ncbi:autotransporter assembly complex protein TamA [Rhodobacteraceae bacterium KMM 6894]|nr:autotransporter assembly complex protein TamA [Rhodobacteraceae bacterium KMM 6894]
MFRQVFFSVSLALVPSVLPWNVALATEVSLIAPNAGKDFTSKLRSESIAIQTVARDNATPQDILAAAQADYARLLGVLYAAGYYGGVISILVDGREAALVPPLGAPERINRITLNVDTGKPFKFSTARVAPLAPGTELPEGFAPGWQARGDDVRDAAKAGVEQWWEVGHAKAEVDSQSITADHRNNTLDVDIALAPGPRLTFGTLTAPEDSKVRASRIRAIAGLPTGDIYSPEKARRSANRLRRTGAFRSVDLQESDTIGPGDTLDFTAKVTDAKPRRVGVGAELASTEGLSLSAFWMHRNLLGGAERLRFDLEVEGIGGDQGEEDYKFSTRFERPATFNSDTTLYVSASVEEENSPDYRERSVEVGTGLAHSFADHLNGEAGIAYRYSEVDDDLGSRTIEQIVFPGRLTYDKRDDPLDARKGQYLGLELDPFFNLGGGTPGARVYADVRTFHSFGQDKSLTFALRAQVGSIIGAKAADVSPDFLFFSGGPGTVRGQAYESLAVDIGGGKRIGGRSFLGLSGEVRKKINDKFGAVAFADTGYIGENDLGSGTGKWHSGAGIGGRYYTGIGPIRVDLATPLDSDAGKDFELYIGIGQAF